MTTIDCAPEVTEALRDGVPVVALESTLLAHGLPPGRNLTVARRLERTVREHGGVPATIAVLDGSVSIGLTAAQLDRVCAPDAGLVKLSDRDLGPALAAGTSGATTVASTAILAGLAGIGVFATGGLGGVHRAATESWDVSADLDVLARTPVLVVCSGVKSILDVPATLEALETRSIPVLGYRTDHFPLFYLRSSAHPVPWRVDDPAQAARAALAHWALGHPRAGVLVANPVPEHAELDHALHADLLTGALDAASEVRGKEVTPAMLEHFHTTSGGASLDANEELVVHNAEVATGIAVALAGRSTVSDRSECS